MSTQITKLLKVFRAAKHRAKLPGGYSNVRDEVTEVIKANLWLNVTKAHTTHARLIADLNRLRARGTQLANMPVKHPAFQLLNLSNNPDSYHFQATYTFWLTGTLGAVSITSTAEGMAAQGYYLPAGGYIYRAFRLADGVKLFDGSFARQGDAVKTPWGFARFSDTNVMVIADIPTAVRAGIVFEAGVTSVRVPEGIFNPGLDGSFEFNRGAYSKRLPPGPFNITTLGRYHSSNAQMHPLDHLSDGIRIGLEVELECPEGRRGSATGVAAAKFLNKHIHNRYALVERDRSLTNGFELVISPASVDFHRKALQTLIAKNTTLSERVNPFKRCNNPSGMDYNAAGIHIHADRRSVKNLLALRLFICTAKDYWGIDWREALFGRSSNGYASTLTEGQVRTAREYQGSKYDALNIAHKATVEARVFSSHTDPLVWLGHVEIFAALIEWTNAMVTAKQERLTVEGFIAFVAKHADKFPHAFKRTDALRKEGVLFTSPPAMANTSDEKMATTFDERMATYA